MGGGSHQWVPTLVTDIAGRAALQDTHIVLEDIDASRLPRMAAYVEHVARVRQIPMSVSTTTHQRAALDGADYVVVNISTGGFASMRHDLEIPERHGVRQSVGDTVGPGGVLRALRKSGIHIVALHNHMVGEQPAFYFTHFWGKGRAEDLAKGFKAALDAQKEAGKGH